MARSSGLNFAFFFTLALFQFPADAATIEVNTLRDDETDNGNCTLREAILAAEADTAVDGCGAGSGADEIHLLVHGLIKLDSDLPKINDSLSILGPGVDKLTISGSQVPGAGWDQAKYRLFRLFGSSPKTYFFRGLTLEGGLAQLATGEEAAGGAIRIAGPHTTTLEHVKIANSYAAYLGGGLYFEQPSPLASPGSLTLKWCTLDGNRAQNLGGGLAAQNTNGTIDIKNSTFSLNESTLGGGIGFN